MPMWILGIVVIVLLGLGGLACRSSASAAPGGDPGRASGEIAALPESAIDSLLARLETEKAPEPTMGAMCYSPVAMSDSNEYVCPVCGERTVYGYDLGWFLQYDLPGCREDAGAIDASDLLDAELDESDFCGHCSPGVEDPALRLAIRYGDGTEIVNEVSRRDLMMLRGFLSGELYFVADREATEPLQPHLERIRQLLGR